MLATSLWLGRRPDARWPLLAAGALWYLAYGYAIFAFSVAPNELSLLYVAVLGLAAWALVLGIYRVADDQLRSLAPRLPKPATSGFLLAVPMLFGLLWLGEILGAASAGGPSEARLDLGLPTDPIWALDLALAVLVVAYGGQRLLRGEPRAMATALPALAFLALIGIAVLGVFIFDIAAGAALEQVPMVIVGMITTIAVIPSVMALQPEPGGSE